MKPVYKIDDHSVHLWQAFVPELLPQIESFNALLCEAERRRASRFRFKAHWERFVVAHGILRKILGLYIGIPPEEIVFTIGHRGKPYLPDRFSHLQFNMSHSHDRIVYAFTTHADIGVDIEKMESDFNDSVAKRFLSPQEYAELIVLPEAEKVLAFYRLWAGREAIIKATEGGLFAPQPSFHLNLFENKQTIKWLSENETHHYHLEYFSIDPGYQSAFAVSGSIKQVISRVWNEDV